MSVVENAAPVAANTKAAKPKASKRPQLTRKERIEQNKDPKSSLAGKQKTMRLNVKYKSDILFNYMQESQGIALSAYERLAGIKRMLARDPKLSAKVDYWIETNLIIVQAQVDEITTELEKVVGGAVFQQQDIIIPDSYETTFEASHPVAHKMVATIEAVDAVLEDVERAYFAGKLDDVNYNDIRQKAMTAVRGSIDRIFKLTRPGQRSGGRYSAIEMAAWIQQGNKLAFQDIPQIAAEIVEQRTGGEAI